MDDPLVGVTIWQSAQLSQKRAVREGYLGELGVDDGTRPLLNGSLSGKRTGNSVSKGSKRKEGNRDGKSRQQETAGDVSPELNGIVSSVEKAGTQHGRGSDGEEDDEEELTESSMLCREGKAAGGRKTPPNTSLPRDHTQFSSPVPQPQNFWLMRLFESKLFDMSIAIGYLFKSKEEDVQAYLGNKLFVSDSTVHLEYM